MSLNDLRQKLQMSNLPPKDVKNVERYQEKAFPQGIPEIGADALRFSLVNDTQSYGGDVNFDIETMHSLLWAAPKVPARCCQAMLSGFKLLLTSRL
jgi:valyl-tRNA synthetase